MNWRIDTSKNVEKFFSKNELTLNEMNELIGKALRYFQGENINVDVKKLKGQWKGFCRIRSGRIRIIAEFDFENSIVFIEKIDWRGGAYR